MGAFVCLFVRLTGDPSFDLVADRRLIRCSEYILMNWNCPEFNRFHHSFVVPAAKCIIRWYGYPYLRGREWTQQKTLPSYKETFILIGRCLGSENILLDKRTKLNYRNILYLSQSFIHPVNPSKRYEIYKKIYSQLCIDQMCNCNCIIISYVLREKLRKPLPPHTLERLYL